MFYNVAYRFPIWNDLDDKSRNARILVLGTILYIIVYSFIYSKYTDDIEIIQKYRSYLYYILAIDLIIIALLMFTKKPKKKKNKKKNQKLIDYNMKYQLMKQQLMQQKIKQNVNQPSQPKQPNLNDINIEIPIYNGMQIQEDDIPVYS